MFEVDNPQMVGKTFAEIKVVYVERLPLPPFVREQMEIIEPLVDILLYVNGRLANLPHAQAPRDPLMSAFGNGC